LIFEYGSILFAFCIHLLEMFQNRGGMRELTMSGSCPLTLQTTITNRLHRCIFVWTKMDSESEAKAYHWRSLMSLFHDDMSSRPQYCYPYKHSRLWNYHGHLVTSTVHVLSDAWTRGISCSCSHLL